MGACGGGARVVAWRGSLAVGKKKKSVFGSECGRTEAGRLARNGLGGRAACDRDGGVVRVSVTTRLWNV